MPTHLERRTVAKTASYTIKPPLDHCGTVFTNAGASGAVTFTLPVATKSLLGHWYRFLGVADQDIVVASSPVDTLIVKNDQTGDSLAASTSGEKIGAEIEAKCMELSAGVYRWSAVGIAVGHTYTVAT